MASLGTQKCTNILLEQSWTSVGKVNAIIFVPLSVAKNGRQVLFSCALEIFVVPNHDIWLPRKFSEQGVARLSKTGQSPTISPDWWLNIKLNRFSWIQKPICFLQSITWDNVACKALGQSLGVSSLPCLWSCACSLPTLLPSSLAPCNIQPSATIADLINTFWEFFPPAAEVW